MKVLLAETIGRPFFFHALLVVLIAPALLAADTAAPVAEKSEVKAAVTVTDNGTTWTLNNGIVKATVNKRNGDLEALVFKGLDTMGHDQGRAGYWEQDPSAAASIGGLTQSLTINPAKNGGERAEVSIKGVTRGQVGLTPGSPGGAQGGTINLDLEIRYTLERGQSGVYVYGIFSHPAAYGPLNVPESRYITKLNQTFNWISVDADRNLLECAPRDWGTGVVVHAKEQRIMSQGFYKNSVEHKYSYTAVQYKTPAYGWSSTKDHVGVWFINPTIEYLSGGASKQELDCHFGDNDNPDPIILDYWRGTHYAGGAGANIAAGEEWSKVIGPIFVYCNALTNPKTPSATDLDTLAATAGNPTVPSAWTENATALWQDALSQAKIEKARWPYDWVNGVDYPHKEQRGTVTGQLVLVDPQASSTKLTNLTIGLTHPDYTGGRGRGGGGGMIEWTHDAKFYQFWSDGTDDGKFTISNVRPGTYTLHAFADGVLGEYTNFNITVVAGKTLDLGKLDWKPVRNGKQIWEIGYPDRTGGKFFKGDGSNYWLWGWCLRYGDLFPNDITYTIGQSDYHKDWFFEQVPHALSDAWKNPDAKDPVNQRFGWVKAESLTTYPQTDTTGPWRTYGRGRETTWTIKFNMANAPKGQAALRVALAGANLTGNSGLAVAVNGQNAGTIRPTSTDALRYNTDKSVWQERTLTFAATLMKQGANEMQLTIPAGEVTTGVVYDYLRLELNEDLKLDATR
jgi:rhamnogalacturonan endolyase